MKPQELMRRAMMHIDRAITDLKATHNKGIENGAIDKLLDVYDWLHRTSDMLDQMEEIERIGDEQR